MDSLWDARYVVIDVETTGSDPVQHRIIEIACLAVEAGKVSERFVSLINAHQPVPPSITALTGITSSMLLTAPEEAEVFARVAQLLAAPRTIVVAHNAAFDRKFVLAAVERLGYRGVDALPWLCTYRLARRLLPPTVQRLGLDGLVEFFGISPAGRHRAGPDAEATAAILQRLLEYAVRYGITTPEELLRLQHARVRHPAHTLPRRLLRLLQRIPETPGVYSFYNRQGQLLYVGKARNLSQRIRAHLTGDNGARRALDPCQIGDICWEETPTELSALLREAERIWTEQPAANVLGKHFPFAFVRLTLSERFPRLEVTRRLPSGEDAWIGPLPSWHHALQLLGFLHQWYRLRPCSAELRLAPHEEACFYAELQRCAAPCNGSISEEAYRRGAEQLVHDARDNLQRWTQALSAAIAQHVQRWEFEQAAALHSLLRVLQRWQQAQLPLEPRACSFLLWLPAGNGILELFCWHQGILRGWWLVTASGDLQQRLISTPPWEPSLSWLDIARLDILARWLARNPQAAVRVPLPADPSDTLAELLSQSLLSVRQPPTTGG